MTEAKPKPKKTIEGKIEFGYGELAAEMGVPVRRARYWMKKHKIGHKTDAGHYRTTLQEILDKAPRIGQALVQKLAERNANRRKPLLMPDETTDGAIRALRSRLSSNTARVRALESKIQRIQNEVATCTRMLRMRGRRSDTGKTKEDQTA